MLELKQSGIKFRYVCIAHPGENNEYVADKRNDRYPVVSAAIKLAKSGTPFQIYKLSAEGNYEFDSVGMDQVYNRPGKTAAVPNGPTKDVEFINAMQDLAEASRALAAMERKGTRDDTAVTEWANLAMTAFDHAGFHAHSMRKLVQNAFPRTETETLPQ